MEVGRDEGSRRGRGGDGGRRMRGAWWEESSRPEGKAGGREGPEGGLSGASQEGNRGCEGHTGQNLKSSCRWDSI